MGAPANKYLQILLEISSKKEVDLYLVGGSIRDHLLGKDCSDFDFTAKNVHDLANRFASETKSPCIPLDATPGRNTLRVIVQKQFHFDFTDMQGNAIEEDLAQRDFSINAMAIQLNDFLEGRETVIDPHQGRADLDNKIIRVIPGPIFSADPLRMLRAFRFASSLEFEISLETIRQIEIDKSKLEQTALERIYYEWILFLSGERVYELLQLMDRTGLVQCAFPETAELRSTFEAEANAWEISLRTFKRLEDLLSIPKTIIPSADHAGFLTGRKRALLKFAALLHRLNPPCMMGVSRVKIDEESKTVRLLKRLTASNADIRFIFRAILCQQEAIETNLEFAGASINESILYRFTKKYDAELMAGIFLACAVQSASEKDLMTESFLQAAHRVTEFYFQRYLPAMDHKALITGDDLIRDFKLTPSPMFQLILNEVEEGRVLGTIQTKNQATAIAQKIIATHKTEQET
jgi:tRNA nucleotidyltransferase/poly(A) polymerase